MTLQRKRKNQQRRRNLLLAGAAIGGLGMVAGGVALARRAAPVSSIKTRNITSIEHPVKVPVYNRRTTLAPSVKPRTITSIKQPGRLSSVKPKVKTTTGTIVHIPGLGKTYYPSSPLVERNVRLGKPGGRPRSRKNWNEWDYYRDRNKGAYNIRNTMRYDKGRFG